MRLADLTWPRRTDRCVLRPVRPDDAEALWRFWRLPEVYRWTTGVETSWEEHLEHLTGSPDRPSERIVVEHDGALVGDVVLFPDDGWAQKPVRDQAKGTGAEIGYGLDPAYGGRGLASEAVREVLAVCFAPAPDGLGLRRVTASCFADNEASWRLMERVGMRREAHHLGDSLHAELGWVDGLDYALLAEEWGGASGPGDGR